LLSVTFKHLQSEAKVNASVIFLASFQKEAASIIAQMPPGRAFMCEETSKLPHLFKTLFQDKLLD
jgi:hypothetical protein